MSLNNSILNLALFTVELDYPSFNSMSIRELQNYIINYSNNLRERPEALQDAVQILFEYKRNQKEYSQLQQVNKESSNDKYSNKQQFDLRRVNPVDMFNMNLMDPFNINSYFTDIFRNAPTENSFVQSYSSTYVNNNGNGYLQENSMKRVGKQEPVVNSNYKKIVNGKIMDDKTKYIE